MTLRVQQNHVRLQIKWQMHDKTWLNTIQLVATHKCHK